MDKRHSATKSVLILDNITIRVRDKFFFSGTHWEIEKSQQWAIIGPNGAGKSILAAAIAGELPIVAGKIVYPRFKSGPNRVGYVSFESHQRLMANEERRDASRYFSKKLNSYTTARDAIRAALPEPRGRVPINLAEVYTWLEMQDLLDRPIRVLSTGEMRKVLIARALVKSPQLLILDEPFEGLDTRANKRLKAIIHNLMHSGMQLILITHRLAEIIPHITHVLGIKDGHLLLEGKRDEILVPDKLDALYATVATDLSTIHCLSDIAKKRADEPKKTWITMKAVTVKYGRKRVLDNLNWTVKSGENWALLGPNGSGKTTLLSLIAGENPQAYSNEIYLFGRRRGSGESIWEIKKRIGLISSEFQIRYRRSITSMAVVLSGFFDSVGLYRHSSAQQRKIAEQWMALLKIEDKADTRFDILSYGQQRLVLLARAMVKSPQLLILDEPCQGLDRSTRKRMMSLLDVIVRHTTTGILYVTHHLKEKPECITHVLRFIQTDAGKYKTTQETLVP
ncbi:MAG: ATP-binding cassette domain-containing protein [Desulfobacterales bacterium]|jgi:molybdate transport system ATP-binding protein